MHIFISYSRTDEAFARRLHNTLVQKGEELWVDWHDLQAFDRSWRDSLFAAIESCKTFAFIMSPASVASGVCAQEVAHAVQHGKRLAVIVLQSVPDSIWKERLPWLDTPQWFLFEQRNDFDLSADLLLQAINTDQDHVEAHTWFYIRARQWEASGDDSRLLQGAELRKAETWLKEQPAKQPPPTSLHHLYIKKSAEASVRGVVSKLKAGIDVTADQLDPTLNVLLAVEAYRRDPLPQIEQVLRQGLRLPRLVWSAPPTISNSTSVTSDDGRYVAISRNDVVQVFDSSSGVEVVSLKHEVYANKLLFSPTGKYLMTWEHTDTIDRLWQRGPVSVWELSTGNIVAKRISDRVFSFQFDPGERYAVAGTDQATAIVFDLKTGKVSYLEHRDAVVEALAFDPNTQYLACGQAGATYTKRGWEVPDDNDMWIWDPVRWRRIARIRGTGEVGHLACSPEGDNLVAACTRGKSCTVRVWKAKYSFWRHRFHLIGSLEHWKQINEIAFHSKFWWMFATACDDGVVRIISATQSKDRYSVGEDYRLLCNGPVSSVVFMPLEKDKDWLKQKTIIAAGSSDHTAREWYGLQEITRVFHPHGVKQVRYNPDCRLLITCTANGGVYAWESNRDQPDADNLNTASLIEELGKRVQRNLTPDEWRDYFADEPYQRTFDHLP